MKIGFVGYGSMASALASRWVGDHELFVGGRNAEKAGALAGELGGGTGSGSGAEAVAFGEVVALATRHEAVFGAIESAGGASAFAGKVVIDMNNPVSIEDGTYVPKTFEGGVSLGEALQRALPGAHVVKAFNMCQATVWGMDPPVFDGRRLVTMICGDDGGAKDRVGELVRAVGSEVLDVGGIVSSRMLEGAAALVIMQLFGGADPKTVLNLVTA